MSDRFDERYDPIDLDYARPTRAEAEREDQGSLARPFEVGPNEPEWYLQLVGDLFVIVPLGEGMYSVRGRMSGDEVHQGILSECKGFYPSAPIMGGSDA